MRIKILLTVMVVLLLNNCGSKEVYNSVVKVTRYQNNLKTKKMNISNNLKMVYLENRVKSDKTLVLIHGFGANKDNWLRLSDRLKNKYHLIIPDLIGNGDSSKPWNINYTIEKQTAMLREFLKKFKHRKLVLVGNSMGGAIALNYASKYDIEALVLIDALGIQAEKSYLDKLSVKDRKALFLNICSVNKYKKMVSVTMHKKLTLPNFAIKNLMKKKCKSSKFDEHKYRGILDDNLNFIDDLTPQAQKITEPTLILWGKQDKIFSYKNAYAFKKNIKKSRVKIFKNAGHIPMIESPLAVRNRIVKFLDRIK